MQEDELVEIIKQKSLKAENLFRINPFYPSLRLHKLKGKLDGAWSISVDNKYRIIFKPLQDGLILFASIWLHAIYDQ
ncbi:type II toxin-antitoxin system RelE/ParE family toxin [Candidatus Peregrinibacteria bacterium]|nr:type II toxin-antitoxin system RelE/ParE family toxin [Candidatus Peregrinibacteria bacterium]